MCVVNAFYRAMIEGSFGESQGKVKRSKRKLATVVNLPFHFH